MRWTITGLMICSLMMMTACATSPSSHTYHGMYKGKPYVLTGGVDEQHATGNCYIQPPHAIGTEPDPYWYPCEQSDLGDVQSGLH